MVQDSEEGKAIGVEEKVGSNAKETRIVISQKPELSHTLRQACSTSSDVL